MFFQIQSKIIHSIKINLYQIIFTLRHGCSPVNLRHIFRTPFPKNTSGRRLLNFLTFFFTFKQVFLHSTVFFYYLKFYFKYFSSEQIYNPSIEYISNSTLEQRNFVVCHTLRGSNANKIEFHNFVENLKSYV